MSRTVVEFTPVGDPWPFVDAWASRHGFKVRSWGDWGRQYTKGDGFWTSQVMVQIEHRESSIVVSGWTPFWMTGGEQALFPDELIAYFPRRKARRLANDLIRALGGPPIGA